jgi:AraC-like DNA-binding protein
MRVESAFTGFHAIAAGAPGHRVLGALHLPRSMPLQTVALHGCRIDRALGSRVEIVEAPPADRRFPARVTESFGVCLKVGPAHRVSADGRDVVYPEDTLCVRSPGCVWATETTGPVGFLSIDLDPSLLPAGFVETRMRFARPSLLPNLFRTAGALRAARSDGHHDEIVSNLVLGLAGAGLLDADELRQSATARISARTREALEQASGRPPSIADLAADLGTSRFALLRRFKSDFGITPHAFVLRVRIDRARERIARGSDLADVAHDLGFADQSHFTRVFKKIVGVTPGEYARRVRAVF